MVDRERIAFDQVSALVVAAGQGSRYASSKPKLLERLATGRTVLEESLWALTRVLPVKQTPYCLVVPKAPRHKAWERLNTAFYQVEGGATRADSVAAGLQSVFTPWVLVHDAARPLARPSEIEQLLEYGIERGRSGLVLGTPIRDSLKRVSASGRIEDCVSREGLWLTFTPQLFPTKLLKQALQAAKERGGCPKDEAEAVWAYGAGPHMVSVVPGNLKLTYPEDLEGLNQALIGRGLVRPREGLHRSERRNGVRADVQMV